MNKALKAAKRKGYMAALRYAPRADNPYTDWRTPQGHVTWARAFRTAWFDGWDLARDLLAQGGKPALPVEDVTTTPGQTTPRDQSTSSIEAEIERIWRDVPDSEWARLPGDLSDHLDHYLYGVPKRAGNTGPDAP